MLQTSILGNEIRMNGSDPWLSLLRITSDGDIQNHAV